MKLRLDMTAVDRAKNPLVSSAGNPSKIPSQLTQDEMAIAA